MRQVVKLETLEKITATGTEIKDADYIVMLVLQKIFGYNIAIVRGTEYAYDVYIFYKPDSDFVDYTWDEYQNSAVVYRNGTDGKDGYAYPILSISTDPTDPEDSDNPEDNNGFEWQIVKKMHQLGYRFELSTGVRFRGSENESIAWAATFSSDNLFEISKFTSFNPLLAIALAALNVLDCDTDEFDKYLA